ncbi:two-component system sensor kinase [Natronococcus amylolyticus DSM 10524]|uniref:Two-component system sensor kinase n=1 Tax=Natronococcus amylolyticus DSM 10524 TaxID=1227497 RepID=L9XIB0_9EURY|nr:two-component system sensor kinase [Natronococcus amylolyticus DSM 10524]
MNDEPATWTIEMAPEAALAGALGAVGLIVLVHLANAATYVCARICAALVGEPMTDDDPTATSS